jgi:CheY-like chemotaxis protein
MKTIVVVTEDGHIARALSEFVRTVLSEMYPAPFQVLPACSADDVLCIVGRQPIDVLMTDHHLLGVTGLDLIRWLGTGLTGTVKILLTNDSRILAAPWKFAGSEVNAVLARPLGRESLKLTLQRWLEAPTKTDQQAPNSGSCLRSGPNCR